MFMAETAFTPEEVAKRLKITTRMATEHLRTGAIPGGYKVKGQWRIDAPDLDKFIAEQKRKASQREE